jgi:hypothetical protein
MPRSRAVSPSATAARLKAAGIRPVLTIRNRDNNGNPPWSPNPPVTAADWNEWWEHVFATVYWLNVRNDYRVDDFEVHNEPNNRGQGWGGTEADYFELVRYTRDAIDSVFSTYLAGRAYHVYAPVTSGGSSWHSMPSSRSRPSSTRWMSTATARTSLTTCAWCTPGWTAPRTPATHCG